MAYETDVLIIGAGPTGSTTALALANSGVRCHIVSRGNWMADSPRAHITNQRANEVFRDLGISEDVARYASPWEQMGDTTFTTSLAGAELIRMRTWGTGDDRRGDYLRASPCGMVDIIQPLLEPILFQKAAEKGATFAFNTEYISHEQDSSGVTATLRDRLDGREFTVRARYMVGADGARSSVVEHLDLPIEGRMARAGTVYAAFAGKPVEALAKDPKAMAIGERLFLNNCSTCHGSDARGSKGFPNLTDNDWLHGGTPEKIEETITLGRTGVMPPMAAAVGTPADVHDVAQYVMSLSGDPHDTIAAGAGRKKFVVCAACHGPDGKGNQALGAPNLTDKVWLHGWGEAAITRMVVEGKTNVMPAQGGRLAPEQIHLLAAYVWNLSQPQLTAAK